MCAGGMEPSWLRSAEALLQRLRRAAFAPDSKTASVLLFAGPPSASSVLTPRFLCVKSFHRKSLCQAAGRPGHSLPSPQSARGHFPVLGSKGESIRPQRLAFSGGLSPEWHYSFHRVCAAASLLIAKPASSADVSFKWDVSADSRRAFCTARWKQPPPNIILL